MSDAAKLPDALDLRRVAAATAVVLGMIAMAALAYQLLDILLLAFVGVVLAAALQPWHAVLCRRGVPKGAAVLLIYLLMLVALLLVALVIGPMLVERLGAFAASLPATYASARSHLQSSDTAAFRVLAQGLPTFERLAPALTNLAPQLYAGTLNLTTSIVMLPAYFVSVLAIAFYWTLELPRFERMMLSLIAVEKRPRALNVGHEIESRLGGFLRGQGLAMLFVAVASGLGYALIGLPNVLALAVVAGLLEAVPLVGPLLAIVPAVLVALPLGGNAVPLVLGFAVVLHLFESNVLIPRIMHRTVGVSALVSLLAVLAFGTLYGIAGVLIAIPMAAVIQVLLDTLLVNAEPAASPAIGEADSAMNDLRAHVHAVRQQARSRMRARSSRMGIDPASADHLVDAVDQQIETAVARVETMMAVSGEGAGALATEQFDRAVQEVETLVETALVAEAESTSA
jgi:predicted PurR-regulated permease PerM